MMNRDSVYSRRRAFMNRTSSGYLRMTIGGSRESVDDDIDDASSDAGSIRSTASTRSWRKTRSRRNRRVRPSLERAQSLYGEASAEHMNFNLNRSNIDPFSFGLRRTPNSSITDIRKPGMDAYQFRNRNLDSSSSVDSDNLRQDALDRDRDSDAYNELSTIAQSPVEAYYSSSSSLDTSSDEDESNGEAAVAREYTDSRDHKDTHDWLMTGSFGSRKDLPQDEGAAAVVATRVNIVEKSKGRNPRALGIHQGLTGAGLNDLATIMQDDPSASVDESTLKEPTLDGTPVTEIVARPESETRAVENGIEEVTARESWEKGDSALERLRDDGEESFGVFCLDQLSHLGDDPKVASSTPSDTIPPSFNESAILRPLMTPSGPEKPPDADLGLGGAQNGTTDQSNSDVQLYSLKDISADSSNAEIGVSIQNSPGEFKDAGAKKGNIGEFGDEVVDGGVGEKSVAKLPVTNGFVKLQDYNSEQIAQTGTNKHEVLPKTHTKTAESEKNDRISPTKTKDARKGSRSPTEGVDFQTPLPHSPGSSPKNGSPRNTLKPNLDSRAFSSPPKERKSPESAPKPMTSPRHSFRHTTLEVVIEEEPLPADGETAATAKKRHNAFAENLAELNMDVSEESFYPDERDGSQEEDTATPGHDVTDGDAAVDDVEEMLITEEERNHVRENEDRSDQNNSNITASTINETDELNEHKVVDNAPVAGANCRRRKSLPITTSDKSGLCSCCLVM